MKKTFMIVGCGSIGKRHMKNILSLGHKVIIVDNSADTLYDLSKKYDIEDYFWYPDAYYRNVDYIIIATPTNVRLDVIKKVAKYKAPIFVEKPLASTFKEAKKIEKFAKKKGLKIIIGMPWRNHPCVKYIEENITKLGTIRLANFIGGSYLPSWHPKQDYRKSYSAKKDGGGITIDAAHEHDLFLHLFGPVRCVWGFKGHISDLEIESDDICQLYMQHENGICSSIVADYIRRFRRRDLEIVGEKGTMNIDFLNGVVTTRIVGRRSVVKSFKNYDLNKMYVQEIINFIKGKGVSIEEGVAVCKLLEDM